ncbi:double-stranded RNA-binding protein 1-like [Mercurialis annua]|uniref:double-stranded RNA-binding protein 1-like n=1 Tax=Mercurialis annua TaxID=3986 RepID=UPI0021606153|nr:double-stranded RNA-binding protein 1-like [Mercurialis annua]
MYKTKLQELCHQKTWLLPEYSIKKEGQDHNPSFQATVTVNGHSFSSPSPAKSSKLAQNEAAQLAFVHFSSSFTSATEQIPRRNEPAVTTIAKENDISTDVQHLYKTLLQIYTQKRGLTLPEYSCEREGPPHASRFKCKVTVDGKTYESLEFFSTLSKAEHAAAKAALMSLGPDRVEEDESAYKNLLQELAQKECYLLPSYTTVKSGESHKPTFVSTVEVAGELFTGHESRTKKQAEFNVAKVAYKALKQRKSMQSSIVSSSINTTHQSTGSSSGNPSQSLMPSSSSNLRQRPTTCLGESNENAESMFPPHQRQKVMPSTSGSRSDLTAYYKQNFQPIIPGCDKQAEEENMARDSCVPLSTGADIPSLDPHIGSPGPDVILSQPCSNVPSLPEQGSSLSVSATDSSTSIPVSSSIEHPTGANTPLHNKIIIHPRGMTMTYPSGSTMLPVSDNNWVAVGTSQSSQ